MIVASMSYAQIAKELDKMRERMWDWLQSNAARTRRDLLKSRTGYAVYHLPEGSKVPNMVLILKGNKRGFEHNGFTWRESNQGKHFYTLSSTPDWWCYEELTPHYIARYIERLGLDCTPMEAMVRICKYRIDGTMVGYETVNAPTKKQNELLRECNSAAKKSYYKTRDGISVVDRVNNYYIYRTFFSNDMGFEVERPLFECLDSMYEARSIVSDDSWQKPKLTGYIEVEDDNPEYFGQKRKKLHVVCGVIKNEGCILCLRRPYTGSPSTAARWEFPGGKIEKGESPEKALKRELDEELDMQDVKVIGHLMTVKHSYYDFDIKLEVYYCKVDDRYLLRQEHIEHRWLRPAELPSLNWAGADRKIIQAFSISYKDTHQFAPEELEHLFLTVGWASADYPEKLVAAMKGYKTVFSAWDGDKLVGLIAAMDDGVMTAYIHYLLVDPEYQGLGVGKRLAHKLKEHYKDYLRITLNATAEAVKFYTSLGFKVDESERAMHLTTMRN